MKSLRLNSFRKMAINLNFADKLKRIFLFNNYYNSQYLSNWSVELLCGKCRPFEKLLQNKTTSCCWENYFSFRKEEVKSNKAYIIATANEDLTAAN